MIRTSRAACAARSPRPTAWASCTAISSPPASTSRTETAIRTSSRSSVADLVEAFAAVAAAGRSSSAVPAADFEQTVLTTEATRIDVRVSAGFGESMS